MAEKITKSDAEWREQLSPEAYKVTRKHGTERPFTNDNFPKDPGRFHCVCCGQPAHYSQRIAGGDSQVEVGDVEAYEARCRECFVPYSSLERAAAGDSSR